jgi:hypothetical protein|tara:strand:- start:179 stop:310 length:132 start_codon:yes stop_codon:yes gene_type:complete
MALKKGQTARLSEEGREHLMQREGHGIETRMGHSFNALLAQLG